MPISKKHKNTTMKIALIGYGKMGKTIEEIAIGRGHTITEKIDIDLPGNFDSEGFRAADVAIEFTAPKAAYDNYVRCFERNKPVVSGTTGWTERMNEIEKMCADGKQTFFYASNFSLGVNIFFEVNRHLARLMNNFDGYDVSMTETHHIHKIDAPSGTAISLANGIIENLDRKTGWTLSPEKDSNSVEITAIREGEVPGIHTIRYESDADYIEITHSAKSRRGFALGVVLAAEFSKDKKGLLGMKDLLGF